MLFWCVWTYLTPCSIVNFEQKNDGWDKHCSGVFLFIFKKYLTARILVVLVNFRLIFTIRINHHRGNNYAAADKITFNEYWIAPIILGYQLSVSNSNPPDCSKQSCVYTFWRRSYHHYFQNFAVQLIIEEKVLWKW